MHARIVKSEQEIGLYRRILDKNEREAQKKETDWMDTKFILESNAVNLLAELRTVKEKLEQVEKDNS